MVRHALVEGIEYQGAWSFIPYFTKGKAVISDLNCGVYIVQATNVPLSGTELNEYYVQGGCCENIENEVEVPSQSGHYLSCLTIKNLYKDYGCCKGECVVPLYECETCGYDATPAVTTIDPPEKLPTAAKNAIIVSNVATCEDAGHISILTASECQAAAGTLPLNDPFVVDFQFFGPNCHLDDGAVTFNKVPQGTGGQFLNCNAKSIDGCLCINGDFKKKSPRPPPPVKKKVPLHHQ